MSNYKKGDKVRITSGIYCLGMTGIFTSVATGSHGTIGCLVKTDEPSGNFSHGQDIVWKYMDDIKLIVSSSWSKAELDILHRDYRRKSVAEIAESLNRSYYSVQSKARSEKIHKHPRREYNARDNRFIQHCTIDPDFTFDDIAEQLHRSPSSLDGRLLLMGIRGQLPSIPNEVK